jgi:hypothetical protein
MTPAIESLGPIIAGPNGGCGRQAIALLLDVTDPEVVVQLEKHPEGPPREKYALGALRLGVLALRQASGELDATAVRQVGQEILRGLEKLLTERGDKIGHDLGSALRQYFDPSTGTLPQKIESLIRNDGELERVLRAHLASENSTLARTLATHVGEGSPLFKLLSPDEAQGLKARIESMMEKVFEEQQQRILSEFSLDNDGSALTRLVRKVRESNGEFTSNVKGLVDALMDEFSLDKPDSALSRLVKKVEDAQNLIGKSLTLDDEGSALSRLKRELQTTIDGLVQSNCSFQAEVREALAKLQSHREAAAHSTLHGHTFEERLGELLGAEARRLNDIHESTGASTGTIAYCKVGDFVTTLGPDSAAPGARIVWEAKSNKSYDLTGALREMEQARKNRQAQVGVFVFAREAAPEGVEPFSRYGNDLVIVWDPEDVSTDLYVKTALSAARALAIRENLHSGESEHALKVIELATRALERQLAYLDEIKSQAETIKNNGDKISERAGKMREALEEQVEEIDRQVAALKTSKGQT